MIENNRYVLKRPTASQNEPHYRIQYEKELNPAQYAAVTNLEGPMLVIAGAGSGKTRTLVYRVARFIESGLSPHNLLLLTFTRKAAQEMLNRAGLLLGTTCDRVAGGTFHSFANTILRRYGPAIGLDRAFTILDRGDAEGIVQLLRTSHGYGERERRFPRKKTLTDMFSASVNKDMPLEEVVLLGYPHFSEHLPEIRKLEKGYADYKQQRFLLDYDDLLLKLRDLLEDHRDIREKLSETHRAILVDEYQDTNKIQARVIRLLCETHENIMVVGDDAQSIYSFRGANFKNIMDLPKEFPKMRIFKLEENYRSTQPILNLTNEIITQAREKYPKKLFTRNEEGRRPILIQAESENEQSRFVCQRVMELREEGVPLEEIAILFRSSHHSFDLEIELIKQGLPFVKRGGFKFIETTHVKDVLAHLRVLFNPRDAISWHRLLLLVDGVGPKKSQAIISAISKETASAAPKTEPLRPDASYNTRWFKAFRDQAGKGSAAPGLKEVVHLFDDLLHEPGVPSEQLTRIYKYYLPLLEHRFDDSPKRMRDLEHLYTITERYPRLEEFLTDVTLEPPNQSVSDIEPMGREDEKLILSTVHSAKGLEWHTVFIIWALDGRFPSIYSFNSEEELEEERRLLYVAATRAKKELYITYPINIYDRALGTVLSRATRFLEGVPRSAFESWSID